MVEMLTIARLNRPRIGWRRNGSPPGRSLSVFARECPGAKREFLLREWLSDVAIMKPITIILSVQLLLALVGCYVAFAYLHWGAMSVAWSRSYRVEFERVKQSPEYRDPPPIRGESFAQVVDGMESTARARADVAGYWFLTCSSAAAFAALLLWTQRRVRHRESEHQRT